MTDRIIQTAITLRDCLVECAHELRYHGQKAMTDSAKELAAIDAATCDNAAIMLQTLGTEVTRLRLGIQHFHAGRMTRWDLLEMTENWNATPDGAPVPAAAVDEKSIETLRLPLRWTAGIDDDLLLHVGTILVGEVFGIKPDEWRARGKTICQHRSNNHPTREAAQAALVAEVMTLATLIA